MSLFGFIFEETPKYTLIKQINPTTTIRRYAPHIRIQTRYDATPKTFGSRGFRPLAGFIFGNNVDANGSSTSIAMTAPVLSQVSKESSYQMAFVLPSTFTRLDQVPQPKDDQVTPISVPEHIMAVKTFSGSGNDLELLAQKESELRKEALEAGFTLDPDPAHVVRSFCDDLFLDKSMVQSTLDTFILENE